MRSRWFEGEASIQGYGLDEQLGTKLRALYQRRKGRDLFDLWDGLVRGGANPQRLVQAFGEYMDAEGHSVSRAEFEENLAAKVADGRFMQDVVPLLAPGVVWQPEDAVRLVRRELVERLPGAGWKGATGRPDHPLMAVVGPQAPAHGGGPARSLPPPLP